MHALQLHARMMTTLFCGGVELHWDRESTLIEYHTHSWCMGRQERQMDQETPSFKQPSLEGKKAEHYLKNKCTTVGAPKTCGCSFLATRKQHRQVCFWKCQQRTQLKVQKLSVPLLRLCFFSLFVFCEFLWLVVTLFRSPFSLMTMTSTMLPRVMLLMSICSITSSFRIMNGGTWGSSFCFRMVG